MNRELHALVSGRVQGVGFRQATASKALQLGLTGWVRNLPDGRVEALLQGGDEAVEAMRLWLQQGPPLAKIDTLETLWRSTHAPQAAFEIRH